MHCNDNTNVCDKQWLAAREISVAIRHDKIAAADGKSKIDRFDRVVHFSGSAV